MTSKFDEQDQINALRSTVNAALDGANDELSPEVKADIAAARNAALRVANQKALELHELQQHEQSLFARLNGLLTNKITLTVPAAVAVIVMVLVSYTPTQSIPALPAEIITVDIPAEDLSLLEDLEFASWLEQQSQEATN